MKRVYLLLLIPLLLISSRSAAQYSIPQGTFSCGGAVRSGTHIIYDAAGQSAADKLTGGSYWVNLGFWYMADRASAVEAMISSFEGRYSGDAVILRWTAGIDSPFDGYNVYRAEEEKGDFTRVNKEIIGTEEVEYIDPTALPGRSYSYYLSVVKGTDELLRSVEVRLSLPSRPVTLYQNFPNPFNPSTNIEFFLPEKTSVKLKIYDTAGRKVKTVLDEIKPAGKYTRGWNGTDSNGDPVSSGVYYCRLSTGKKAITKKLVLMR